jgi:hypothetical protein
MVFVRFFSTELLLQRTFAGILASTRFGALIGFGVVDSQEAM